MKVLKVRQPPSVSPCHGEALNIADLALASHLIGVSRFGVDLTEFLRTAAVGEILFAIPEFADAHPRFQLGAPGIESKAESAKGGG